MKSYIVMPGMVYGEVKSPLVDAGIQYSRSRPIPMALRPAISRGQAGVIGKGLSRWVDVHVDDAADLFLLLWNAVLSGSEKAGHGWEGIYIAASDDFNWYESAKETGRVLVELGLSATDEVTTYTPEEVAKYYPFVSPLADGRIEQLLRASQGTDVHFGSNARGRGTHSYALGWKPKYSTKDYLASIKGEIEIILKGDARQPY